MHGPSFSQAIPTAKGQALADEYGIKFFETVRLKKHNICNCLLMFLMSTDCDFKWLQSAKTNLNVESVFLSIAKDIKQRLTETDTKAEVRTVLHSFILSLYRQR